MSETQIQQGLEELGREGREWLMGRDNPRNAGMIDYAEGEACE